MGLTIHYKGKLNSAFELPSLIEEVREIAIEKGWEYFVFEENFKNDLFTTPPEIENLYGVMALPKGSEPVCFSFLSDGRMCGIINFNVCKINNSIDEDLTFDLFTKTQYAGFEVHKSIIVLMDYISKKYLTDFECYDEGQYWETRDEDLLIKTFRKYESLIDGFASRLEMMPPNPGETTEEHLFRLANSVQDSLQNSDDSLPNLSIEEENQFKKMKIELEHDGFFGASNSDIPPEIEGQFLDYIIEFEKQFKNAGRTTVYEKIGKPSFLKSSEIPPEALDEELEKLFQLLEQHNIYLEVLDDYDNETLLIYDFITQEFFNEEIDDISIPGLNSNFIYEEFHPNHTEDLKKDSQEFWNSFFANNSERFDEFTLGDLLNSDEMIDFRYAFSTFTNIKIKVLQVDFDIENKKAKTKVRLKFDAHIDNKNKVIFDCKSSMKFGYQDGHWYLKKVDLPK